MAPIYLSLVVPVFNEESNLEELLDRLAGAAEGIGRPWEAVLVNDGSRDGSLEILRRRALADPHLVVVDFNRNYGQHAAVFAGYEAARGEIIVQLSDYGCMLRAYRRQVVRTLCASQEISTFIPVLADMFAGRVTEIPVAHAERKRGDSKYSLWKLVRLQFDLLTSFSNWPLRLSMGIGVAMATLAMVAAMVLIGGRLLRGPEWAASGIFTLFAGVFFFLGVELFAIGLLGEYVGRIYAEVRRRPRYVVREILRSGHVERPEETTSAGASR